ncbi:hypothetical protein ACQEU5_18510 [Marinactinospora thermotolerans]|uniref:Uncharacterized protein n=1 Tax=Marinactinospora thermotolerans DSM 45154 TaxID=1122192 RepID=A0A1T4T5W8_9ACTN|nr:hypothetical protein [Marinactinospora thermotolerans]SKA35885.1 hypothetical protein SAMN02745673_04551 [Marinactinospora thermotolerans DSM 45154]
MLTGDGHCLDRGRGDVQWAYALRALTLELRAAGLEVRPDGGTGAVEAAPRRADGIDPKGPRRRAILRPHRGRLWWWLDCPDDQGAWWALTPLTPASRTSEAARRIVRMLLPGQY